MLLTLVAASLFVVSLLSEVRYALSPPEPLDLGVLATARLGAEQAGRYVGARVELDVSRAVRYRRAGDGSEYRLAPIMGVAAHTRWVQYRVPAEVAGPRFLPPRRVAGRLARAGDLGLRYRGVVAALAAAGARQAESAWVLIDGADPPASRWLIGLVGLLCAFGLWSLVGLFSMLRRIAPAA
jgi:hypothetical protein